MTRRVVYYAHAIALYHSTEEMEMTSVITKELGHLDIINPKYIPGNGTMQPYFNTIDLCDVVVFSRYKGKVMAGVGAEINYALSKSKAVYELRNGKLRIVRHPVSYLGRDETRRLYWEGN
ncbi:MAG: hypothetical protein QXX17_05140 [Conexivisphaerales archaeon]